ncbi:MAG TPA: transporter substrate-binding domain-containing protein [Candidatus Bathyarchaeia archaeon]|nr:transporter substrate-binding domain-containing protein [Candidatus Bathyarchaeia archaeon]
MPRALLVAFAAVLAMSFATPSTAGADALEKITREKTFNIGYIPVPPAIIKDPKTGELSGYFVDAIRLICEQMGVKPVFVEAAWGTFIAGLQSGQFDLSIATTFATVPRALAVDFTRPIQYNAYSAIVRKGDTRFKSLADIDKPGVTVAVVQGAAGHEYAKQNFKNATLVVLATADLTAPFVEVSAKRVDVGIEDSWSTRRYAAGHPEVVDLFADHPYNVLPIAWAVRKGEPELLNFINTAIEYLRVNGRLDQFAAKYGPNGFFQVRTQYQPIGTPH